MHSNDVILLLNTGTVAFSPANAVIFNKQAVGTKSPAREVILTNTAKTALRISSIKVSATIWHDINLSCECGGGSKLHDQRRIHAEIAGSNIGDSHDQRQCIFKADGDRTLWDRRLGWWPTQARFWLEWGVQP